LTNVFDQAQQPPVQSQESQAQQMTSEQQESYLAKLVAAKGENWKDPEVLAKGKLEADGYIKNLEEQLKQMREDIQKQDYAKTLLEELQNKATSPTNVKPVVANNTNNGGTNTDGNTPPQVSEDTLKSLVEQTLTARELENTVKQNLAIVDQELEKSYGTEAPLVVQKKAQELGLSIQRLQELASESPTAFFNLIGEPKKSFQPIVQGTVRTEGVNMQASTERNFDYYQKLRRENKSLYYTPKIQRQMMDDAARLGSKWK
jgi:multidrug efflux pump subunit AcrB